MPPKPVSTIDGARAAAAVRPQLWIGGRTTQNVRVRKDEVHRSPDQWGRTFDDIKESLVDRLCEVAIEACEAGLASVIDALGRSASAEASDTEMAAQVRSERERDEARRECLRMVSDAKSEMERLRAESEAWKAELSRARQQLDVAMAERSKLMATFQLLQRALSGELEVADPGRDAVMHPRPLQEVRIDKTFEYLPPPPSLAPPVAETQLSLAEAHPSAAEEVKHLLDQVKAAYDLDVNSDRSSAELVESLTTRLRQARDVTVAHSILRKREATALFEQQIDVMLDLAAGTSFGRHLSISAFAAREPVTSNQVNEGHG